MAKQLDAQKWYDAAFAQAQKCKTLWQQFRGHLFDAGYMFGKCRDACHHGDWQLFLDSQHHKMKRRTIDFYIQLSEAALEWARADKPELKGETLLAHARLVMMESPKPLVALLRDLRELKPFGEYDAVKYRTQKLLAGRPSQLELNFQTTWSVLDTLERIEALSWAELPEGKTEHDVLRDLDAKLSAIQTKVRAQLQEATDI